MADITVTVTNNSPLLTGVSGDTPIAVSVTESAPITVAVGVDSRNALYLRSILVDLSGITEGQSLVYSGGQIVAGDVSVDLSPYALTSYVNTQDTAVLATVAAGYQPLGTYLTPSSTHTLTNKSGAISQWTNDAAYTTLAGVAGVGYLLSSVAATTYQAKFTAQNANKVYAGPSTGADAVPAFRSLVSADIPSLPYLSSTLPGNTRLLFDNSGAVAGDAALTWVAPTLTVPVVGITGGEYFGDGDIYGLVGDLTGTDTAAQFVTGFQLNARTASVLTVNPSVLDGVVVDADSRVPSGRTLARGTAGNFSFRQSAAGTTTNGYATFAQTNVTTGHVDTLATSTLYTYGESGSVGKYYGLYFQNGILATSIPEFSVIWAPDYAAVSANPYLLWGDGRAVRRIKYESDGNMIDAWYNVDFTKYTPGATNFERLEIGKWVGNVVRIGPTAGGTGTLRAMQITGASVSVDGALTASNLSGTNTGDQDLSSYALSANVVPNTRTVNGHALNANVSVTASDVGLGSVENAAASTLYQPIGSYATLVGVETLTNKTLTTPTIASFANSTHSHLNTAGGGTITAAAISDLGSAAVAFTNKTGNISQWTNDSSYTTLAAVGAAYQPLDSDLTAIAALATNGFAVRTGTGAWTIDTSTYLTTATAGSTYLPLAGGTLTGNLLFTDNTYDIGASGATRPRDYFGARNVAIGGRFSIVTSGQPTVGIGRNGSVGGLDIFGNDLTTPLANVGATAFAIASTTTFGWASGAITQSQDVILARDAANTLAQRNSTAAQTFNLYNTYTDASNYERGFIRYSGNVLQIGHANAGTGSARFLNLLYANSSTAAVVIGSANSGISIGDGGDQSGANYSRVTLGGGTKRSATSGNSVTVDLGENFNPTSTSTQIAIPLHIHPTINYSNATPGAGSYEALKIAVTETALPTGTNYLIRASAGSGGATDKFSVQNNAVTTWVGGTVTTSTPLLDISQTWNAGAVTFTGIKANFTVTASNNVGFFLDLQRAGVSKFSVNEFGKTTAVSYIDSVINTDGLANHLTILSGKGINFAVSASAQSGTLYAGAGGNAIDQRNGTNAQTFNLYNTYTDASNYERLAVKWSSSTAILQTENAGTGSARILEIRQQDGGIAFRAPGAATNGVLVGFIQNSNAYDRVTVGHASSNSSATSGTDRLAVIKGSWIPSATSTMVGVGLAIVPTVNYSAGTPGAGSYEALKIAVTETALPTGTNYLIRASAGAAGSTDKFSVMNTGRVDITGNIVKASGPIEINANATGDFFRLGITGSGIIMRSTNGDGYQWGANSSSGTFGLYSVTNHIIDQRGGTNAQTFNLYETYTDASNYERGQIAMGSDAMSIGWQSAGTGAANGYISLVPKGSGYVAVAGSLVASAAVVSPVIGTGVDASTAYFAWGAANDIKLSRSAATTLALTNATTGGVSLQLAEMTAPAAPAADSVRLYAEDNGAGKTRIMALFATGAAQQIAIQP